MKFRLYIVGVLLLALSACRDNDRSITGLTEEHGSKTIIHGSANLEHDSYISLIVHGSADLEDVKISKDLDVNGSLKAEDCTFKEVVVHGAGSFEECKISGLIRVLGSADFDDCKLKKVEITSSSTEFEECKVSEILMKKNSSILNSSQKVTLKDTVVSGDVTFEQGNGIVVLKDGAKVKGKVVGGKIVKD